MSTGRAGAFQQVLGPGGGPATVVNQGLPAVFLNAWPVRIISAAGAQFLDDVARPGFASLVFGGAVIDPRQIRALTFPGDSVGVSQNGPFIVTGPAGEGAAVSGSPVRISGADLAGLVRTLRILADGTAKAREDALPMTWVSAAATAAAANAVIADTGALAAGDYDFDVQLACADTTAALGKCVLLEHRNAANGATLQTLAMVAQQDSKQILLRRYTLALNERLRVINGAVAGAAASRQFGAIGRRLS